MLCVSVHLLKQHLMYGLNVLLILLDLVLVGRQGRHVGVAIKRHSRFAD